MQLTQWGWVGKLPNVAGVVNAGGLCGVFKVWWGVELRWLGVEFEVQVSRAEVS